MARTRLSATTTGCSVPTSSTTAVTKRWGAPGATSTLRRSDARRTGRTRPRATPRPRPTRGGTGTTNTAPPSPAVASLPSSARLAGGLRDGLCLSASKASSQRLVTWWRGVPAECHRSRLQIRVAQESVYEPGWPADAAPVVVPQRRHQPRAVGWEHQVGQGALPERTIAVLAPSGGLRRARLDQHVMPPRIQGPLRPTREDHVTAPAVDIPHPPP